MEKKFRLLLLLALLMTAATGAWADETLLLTIESRDYKTFKSGSKTFDDKVTVTFSNSVQNDGDNWGWYANSSASLLTVAGINGYTITSCKFYVEINGDAMTGYTIKGESPSVYLNNLNVYTDNSQSVKIGKNGITKIEVYEAAAAPAGYTVSMKDGVKDADKWTISPNPAPEGSPVTIQYTGRLKVKGVTATSDEKPAEATPALSITSPSVGQVIGSDGKNYAYGSLPTGVTAVAKICYVSGSNGLALALADEGTLDWSTAIETCAAHTPAFTGGTWKLASLDEWENMISTAGNQTDLRDGFSSVGGTNMEENCYWSSSEVDSESAWLYYFGNGQGYSIDDYKDYGYYVRACLAFTVEQSAKPAATVTTAPTGAAIVGVGKTTALVSGGVADGGTLMYAVTTTNTMPTSTDGFSADVPTAQTITASGTVYVWYYVKGDDTHSDSEIAGPVSVTVAPASTPLDNTIKAWTAGTYAVPAGGLTYSDAITVSGDVTLVLTDGTTLTLNKGINLASGATLTIQGNGTMNVNGTDGNTSSTVGGNHGTLVLTSGTLTATGGNGGSVGEWSEDSHGGAGGAAINGTVIVDGGTLTAKGGNGGNVGKWSENSHGGAGGAAISGSLTINAGTVTTTNGAAGSVGEFCEDCSGGAAGKAVAGTVTDKR